MLIEEVPAARLDDITILKYNKAKIPKRWWIAIPVLLGGVAGILTSVLSRMSWGDAVVVELFARPTGLFAHEAVFEAILEKAKSRNSVTPPTASSLFRIRTATIYRSPHSPIIGLDINQGLIKMDHPSIAVGV